MATDDPQMLESWLTAKFKRMMIDDPRLVRESELTAAAAHLSITILERLPRRRSVTDGNEDLNLEAYLNKTWSCELKKFLRKERQSDSLKKRVSLDVAERDEARLRSMSDQPVKEYLANELCLKIREVLDRLDPQEQWIINARYGYSQPKISMKEIASKLNITTPTARKRLESAKKHLRCELAKAGITEEAYIHDDY